MQGYMEIVTALGGVIPALFVISSARSTKDQKQNKKTNKLPEQDRAENARPVPSQAEGDEETVDEALEKQQTH
jgi:hypothetical protein